MTMLSAVISEGLYLSLPGAGMAGRTYYATDTKRIWYDTGSAWVDVTPGPAISAIQQAAYTYAADTGAANAYVVALSPAPTLAAGSQVVFKATAANTGASTLAVNGGSAIAIKKLATAALTGGEILAGQMVRLYFDGTNFQL